MKGRVTREHDKRQGYERVYWEGGSAITDADLNAAFDAHGERHEDLVQDWLTPAGTTDPGWRVHDLTSNIVSGQEMVDFDLDVGHYMLDGKTLKNPNEYPFSDQPFALAASLEPFMSLPKPTVADLEALPNNQRHDAVLLDSQTLLVRVTEDSELDEVAIRSDPATRLRQSPKVRVVPGVDSSCALARPEAIALLVEPHGSFNLPSPRIESSGRLRVHLGQPDSPDNPCAPEITTGYYGRLNHTIKVMLTASNSFVWGYRNGEGLYRAELVDNTTLRMVTPFRDSAAFPVSNQIVELLAWDSRLPNGEVTAVSLGRFHSIDEGYKPDDETLTLDTAVDADLRAWYDDRAAAGESVFLFLRFWEEPDTEDGTHTDTALNVRLANTGIFLDFLDSGCPGDQWTFSVRGNANDTVFPKRMLETDGQPPEAIQRSVDLIALIHWEVRDGEVHGHIHDCRRRVRPLWKLRGCCTFTVGNGINSHGDFDSLDDAIAALPHEGGRICLLAGTHAVGTKIANRQNITIEGCRGQTFLESTGSLFPVLEIRECANIQLKDFSIHDGRGLAVAGANNKDLALGRISTSGHGSAVSLVQSENLSIVDCEFFAEAEPTIIPPEDFPDLRPLAFVGGNGIVVRSSSFRCEDKGLTYQSLGGLQIASNSRHVRIQDNVIAGGLGHGITFGHLLHIKVEGFKYRDQDKLAQLSEAMAHGFEKKSEWHHNRRKASIDGRYLLDNAESVSEEVAMMEAIIAVMKIGLYENEFGISKVEAQGCLGIDPTPTPPEPDDEDEDWGRYIIKGEIRHVHVIGNEIVGMGGSGISIPSWNISLRSSFGENIIRELTVHGNHIRRCSRVAISSTMLNAELQEIGFGGIALEVVKSATISGNVIENIGQDVRSPTVGIYIADATFCTLDGNLIAGIGRAENRGDLNVLGVQGGIVIDSASPLYDLPPGGAGNSGIKSAEALLHGQPMMVRLLAAYEESDSAAKHYSRTIAWGEALRIVNNQVVVNFGPSLDVRGRGSFHISENSFSSLAARRNSERPRIAISLSVIHTEYGFGELLAQLFAKHFPINQKQSREYILQLVERILSKLKDIFYAKGLWERLADKNAIRFNNNLVRSEAFTTGELNFAQHTIITPHCMIVSDNVFQSPNSGQQALSEILNFFGVGFYSTQCMSNLFESGPPDDLSRSAYTVGLNNSTYLNHGSHNIMSDKLKTADLTGSGNLSNLLS